MASVLKTGGGLQPPVGSNPTISANLNDPTQSEQIVVSCLD